MQRISGLCLLEDVGIVPGFGVEDFCSDAAKFSQVCGFAQPFPQLFAVFKVGDEEVPILFQAEHGIPSAAKGDGIGVQKLIVEFFQRLYVSAAYQHTGVAHKTSANHNGLYLGVFFCDAINIGRNQNIAVEAKGIFAVLESILEHIHMQIAVVKLLSCPRMDSQFFDGIAVKNL